VPKKGVDKKMMRAKIAKNAIELFIKYGFDHMTVDDVAYKSKIPKGSVYSFFESKDDILFAIIENEQEFYDEEIRLKIQNSKTLEEKILSLFDLCVSQTTINQNRQKIYQEFVCLVLNNKNLKMVKFLKNIQQKYLKWLEQIFEDAIKDGQIKQHGVLFAKGLFAMAESVLLFSAIENYNAKDILQNNIENLLKLLRIDDENSY